MGYLEEDWAAILMHGIGDAPEGSHFVIRFDAGLAGLHRFTVLADIREPGDQRAQFLRG